MTRVEYRVLSRPAKVYWAGFESDTLKLQQAGWEIAAHEDIAYDRIQLLLRHQSMRLWAVSAAADWHYRRMAAESASGRLYEPGNEPPLHFHVQAAAPRIEVQRIAGAIPFEQFRQIDAKPQYVEHEIKSLEDFKIFATPLARTEELIVDPQSVQAMLDRIRELQVPEQERIRAKQRLAASREGRVATESAPRQVFHAQILSIQDRIAA